MDCSRNPIRPPLCTPPVAHLAAAEHLNGLKQQISGFDFGRGFALPALPIFGNLTLQGKNRNIFALHRI